MAGTAMAQTTENSADPISETPTVIPSKIPADISPGIPPNIPTDERIVAVLRHLGISSAHFAGRAAADWTGLAQSHPDAIASLALIFPSAFDPKVLASVAPRLLVFRGDQGPSAEMVERNLLALPEATLVTLPKYHSPNNYADVAVERGEDIRRGLGEFLDKMEERKTTASNIAPVQAEGEVAGISYRVQGSGPPLVLLPLGAAPSQWDPLLPSLTENYSTITLGGAELGLVANLEYRGRTPGYLGAVAALLDQARIQPGDTVLEVGCGTGVLVRWLARRTGQRNRILGIDVNRFFLREAAALVKKASLEQVIRFKGGSAEALPLADNSIDVAMSSTVIQRVDAERMLAEMLRVTKPGGRVAVLGHAHDMNRWVNLPLSANLKSKIESPPWGDDPGHPLGCDDATLYRLFNRLGLSNIAMFPYLSTFTDGPRLQNLQYNVLSTLSRDEAEEWRSAVAQAEAEGAFFLSTPFHCAVGTKP